jgi:hypothetical protein
VGNDYLSNYVVEAGGWTPYHAHDTFLQTAIDSGFLGVLALVILLLVALVGAVRYLARERSAAAAWPLMIVVYLLAGSYTETYLANYNTVEWMFFVAALLYPIRAATYEPVPSPSVVSYDAFGHADEPLPIGRRFGEQPPHFQGR